MDVRSSCKSHQWRGVTLWFVPFHTLRMDDAVGGLEPLVPHFEYVNTKTKAVTQDEPPAYREARERSRKNGKTIRSEWERRNLWGMRENTFVLCLPSIVAVDFPEFDENIPAAVRLFSALWDERDTPTEERWEVFKLMIPVDLVNALWDGYSVTRDHSMDAAPALQEEVPPDPNDLEAVAPTSQDSAPSGNS